MNLTFDATLRLTLPAPKRPDQQSLYIFNQYRAGSSVVEAAAMALADVTGLDGNNMTQQLYALGVSLFDPLDYNSSSVHLADDGAPLLRICDFGGYVNYGFREVPMGFARGFAYPGAAVLIARDPRDIGISHYRAVHQHTMENATVGAQIAKLRAQTGAMPLEDYLLLDETIHFLNRISLCYGPMIAAGMRVIRYEDLFVDGAFSLDALCATLADTFGPFAQIDLAALQAQTATRVANSAALQGHATSASTALHSRLPTDIAAAYSAKLRAALDLLGYDA